MPHDVVVHDDPPDDPLGDDSRLERLTVDDDAGHDNADPDDPFDWGPPDDA